MHPGGNSVAYPTAVEDLEFAAEIVRLHRVGRIVISPQCLDRDTERSDRGYPELGDQVDDKPDVPRRVSRSHDLGDGH